MTDRIPSPEGTPDLVVVGRIRGPYGIKGWVHVAAFTEPEENIDRYRPWYLGREGEGKWRRVEVTNTRPHKQGYVAHLAGVDDRTSAEGFAGLDIAVPETLLGETEEGEYYWRDLIGTMVLDGHGSMLGRVADLMETGANDVLVVDSENGERLLIPFHRKHVEAVDLERGTIRVDWQQE
jgi:16S rRNA processing protein RimM